MSRWMLIGLVVALGAACGGCAASGVADVGGTTWRGEGGTWQIGDGTLAVDDATMVPLRLETIGGRSLWLPAVGEAGVLWFERDGDRLRVWAYEGPAAARPAAVTLLPRAARLVVAGPTQRLEASIERELPPATPPDDLRERLAAATADDFVLVADLQRAESR